jgi:hypothetical protein
MVIDLTLLASIVSAAAAVILVVLGLPPFLRWWRERRQLPTQLPPATTPATPTIQVHLWGPSQAVRDATSPSDRDDSIPHATSAIDAPSSKTVFKNLTSSPPSRRHAPPKAEEVMLFDKTLEIEATGYAEVHERLRKGTVVEGIAEELSGQHFDFYVMDQRNYARFSEDRGGTDIYAQEDRVAFNFRKKIPRDGVWYFIFDTYGKQTNREVRFELRAIEEG